MSTGIPRRFAALNTSSSLFIMPWQRRRRRKLEEEAACLCFQALPSLDSLDFFSHLCISLIKDLIEHADNIDMSSPES